MVMAHLAHLEHFIGILDVPAFSIFFRESTEMQQSVPAELLRSKVLGDIHSLDFLGFFFVCSEAFGSTDAWMLLLLMLHKPTTHLGWWE